MKKRTRTILYAAAAVLLVLGLAGWYFIHRIVHGNVTLVGAKETIPARSATVPAFVRGEADWPCWRGPSGDGKSAVKGIRSDWAGGLRKLWEVNFLCQGDSNATWSAPVVCGNRLVVMGREEGKDIVFCLDPNDGKLLWLDSYAAPTGSSYGPGSRATPCIDGEFVYTFGRGGDLSCLRLADGAKVWRRNVKEEGGAEPQWGMASSPLVCGDKVIVQCGGSSHTAAFDKAGGATAWKSGPGDAAYAAIARVDVGGKPMVLSFHARGLSCLDAGTGREAWTVPWKTDYDVNATTPVVDGDTVFLTSGYDTGCLALQAGEKAAKTLWRGQNIASQHSDAVVVDGFLYGFSGQSGQNKGDLVCLELKTGAEKWRTGEVGWGTLLFVDGYLLTQDIKGNVFLVKPDPAAFRKVAEFRGALGAVNSPAWTMPVVANGRLFLRYLQRLVCYDLAGK